MFCLPLSLVFGIVGIFKDRPRWLAIVVSIVALLLMSPFLWSLISQCAI
jgi:hypothetical protein